MSKVALVTDSTAYIPDDLLKKYEITVAPQVLIWGEETFRDGVDIQPDEFYSRLEKSKVMPTTSQVSMVDMKNIFEKLVNEGHDVLGIFVSDKLSGTMDSARQAVKMLPGMAEKISILDSTSVAMGMGFHVLAAARASQGGESLEECRKLAEEARKHTGVFFTVETLEFLRRGGRIGGAAALLGTMLNVKPVLELREGRIEPIEKVRTKRKATERMLELVIEKIGGKRTGAIGQPARPCRRRSAGIAIDGIHADQPHRTDLYLRQPGGRYACRPRHCRPGLHGRDVDIFLSPSREKVEKMGRKAHFFMN